MSESEAGPGLSFERANYTTPQAEAGPPCANCNRPLGEQYWQWSGKQVCESCRGKISGLLVASQSNQAFARAVLLGGATALGTGVAYAVFVAMTKYQLALVTIGIAFLIAKVMRRCSAGVGGRKFQILAVALTYLASAMGYAPGVFGAFNGAATESAPSFLLFIKITLMAPIISATEAPIGLLIIGFGLWEAWKLSRGLPLSLEGPYRATPAAGAPVG